MTETYDQLGGQANSDDELVDTFVTCLDLRVRRAFTRNPHTIGLIATACRGGWKPKALAEHCSQGIPTTTSAASAAIMRRLEWANAHAPAEPAPKARRVTTAPRRHRGPCSHPDGHECPWLNETTSNGKAVRCRCNQGGA